MAYTFAVVSIAAGCLFVLAFFLYRRFVCHQYFKKHGIPGPKPNWLFGNLLELWSRPERHLVLQGWQQKYGKFYGYYEGSTPVLVTSDVDAVENICIKQFSDFPGRKSLPIIPEKNVQGPAANIFHQSGEPWKRLRTICSPGFSTGRLKSYSPLILKSERDLMTVLNDRSQTGQSFDISTQFQCMALDIIFEVAFGIELGSVNNQNGKNPLLPQFQKLINSIILKESAPLKIAKVFPEIAPLLGAVIVRRSKRNGGLMGPIGHISKIGSQVIKMRTEDEAKRRNDLLQMLIDAMQQDPKRPDLRPLSDKEILAQTIQFFMAGTNTTTFTLSFATYCLAKFPKCQQKLFEEIQTHMPDVLSGKDPEYDHVMSLHYLDWFLHEVLRLYPIAIGVVNRLAASQTQLGGFHVEAGQNVHVNVWAIHHDPELWGPVAPDDFYPERFSPDYPTTASRPNHAFLGFGAGPRMCIGQRLALWETKLTLVNLVSRFQILPPPEGYPADGIPVVGSLGLLPRDGVWVSLHPRNL